MIRKVTFGSALGVVGLLVLHTGAFAAGPYTSGTLGYDYSYPQCGLSAPTPASFGIVGVNAGYPFNYYNSCLASEFAAAARTGNATLYINTGYSRKYTRIDGTHTTQDCATKSRSVTASPTQQAAWAVGCSEAERDIAYAKTQGIAATSPAVWWLDVETANSWSTGDLSLNQYTILGIVSTLRANTTAWIGIYSTPQQWTTIMGGFQAPVDAEWHATGQKTLQGATSYCTENSFSGAKIWLVQYVTSIDNDSAC